MLAKKANANSADPDQTASEEAVWSGSSLFAILSSGNHFVNPSTDNKHFIWEQREKSCWNFRTLNFTVVNLRVYNKY